MVYGGVKVEGAREFRRAARKAGIDLKQMREVHRAAANIVVGKARGWAPKVSGSLAGTIRAGATQTAGIVRAGNNRKSKAGVPYAPPIHWGWKARNIKANPFLSYAAQATEVQWLEIYHDKVEEILDPFFYY